MVVLLSVACSGADDSEASCSSAHRSGTYVAHFTERPAGTCGAITDQVVQLSPGEASLPAGCAFDAPDSVSSDECGLTRQYSCPLDGAPGTVSVVAFSKERDGGRSFTGTLTAKMYDGTGALACASTYDVTWSRQ